MHFGLSDEQRSFARDAVARFSGAYAADGRPDAQARAAHSASVKWLVPKAFGGEGRSLLDVAAAVEAIAKDGIGSTVLGRAVLAPLALLSLGDEAQRRKWLAEICDGSARFAVAVEERGNPQPDPIPVLIDAEDANFVLLWREVGGASILPAAGLSEHLTHSIDMDRRIGAISRSVQPIAELAATADLRRVTNAGRIILAAESLGTAQALCDRTLGYVQSRVQFGRAIGSYQGVKFNCADMVTMLEPCRALVWHAAYAHDVDLEEADLLALHTKAHVGDVAREIGRMAVELHGAYGFSQKSGLHRGVRRIAFNRQLLGSPDDCREIAGKLQGF